MAFLNGTLKKGIEMVIEYTDLEEKVKDCDMVWTGEDIVVLYEKGMDSIFGIMKGAASIDEALAQGKENIENTSENIVRLINLL